MKNNSRNEVALRSELRPRADSTRKPFLLRGCVCVAALFFLGFAAQESRAQQPPQQPPPAQPQAQPPAQPSGQAQPQLKRPAEGQPAIAVEVKTVSVLATVRDKHGKIIPDLSKDDFELDEDGRPQTINYFAHESDLPLRLGLLVDTSLSQRKVIDQERSASYTFLDQLLRQDKDLAFVIHFDHEVELLQDFTPSKPKLQEALQKLATPAPDYNGGGSSGGGSGNGGYGGGGRQGGHMHGGTQLYDAIYLASDELMSKQQGRKALIILSDGVDRGSKETMGEAIATAQRADTIIYSIYFSDEDDYGSSPSGFGMGGRGGMHGGRGRYPQEERPDGKKVLEQISKDTGGQLFKASKKETVDKIYAEIQEDLRNQYSLAYTPDKGNTYGYHKIQLTVPKQKDLVILARDGYYYGQ
ncbi:MAG: VWA domain-containing protein [Candidatus Acidiferrum sp.]